MSAISLTTAFGPLALMLVGHATADYPLQGDWLSKAKNHKLDLVPGQTIWPMALLSHAAIHGAFVFAATGSAILGIAEVVCHTAIDYSKCDGRLTYNQDQSLHVACKFIWFGLLILGLKP